MKLEKTDTIKVLLLEENKTPIINFGKLGDSSKKDLKLKSNEQSNKVIIDIYERIFQKIINDEKLINFVIDEKKSEFPTDSVNYIAFNNFISTLNEEIKKSIKMFEDLIVIKNTIYE